MTLRTRLAVLTASAVALAVVAASIAALFIIKATMVAGIDRELKRQFPRANQIAADMPKGDGQSSGAMRELDSSQIGVEIVSPDGSTVTRRPSGTVRYKIDQNDGERLKPGEKPRITNETIDGDRYRMVSAVLDNGEVLRLARPLHDVDATMGRIGWLLAAVTLVGVVLAGLAGWLISRTQLRPVRRLALAAETVAATRDLGHRVEVRAGRPDEVTRVATSLNAMLTALDEAREQQRRLIDDVGHELRTPLATLRNDLGVLLRLHRNPGLRLSDTDHASLLRDLDSEATVLTGLVAEVLDLARDEFEPEPVGPVEIREVAERAAERTRRVNPDVTLTVTGDEATALVRAGSLERAIANLARNAVQVSAAGQKVEIITARRDERIEVAVLDRGPGLDDTDLDRLFDRFYRGAAARSRPGSGLGLAIVAQVAAQHQGEVTAHNRDGGGACFTLSIPLSTQDEQQNS